MVANCFFRRVLKSERKKINTVQEKEKFYTEFFSEEEIKAATSTLDSR